MDISMHTNFGNAVKGYEFNHPWNCNRTFKIHEIVKNAKLKSDSEKEEFYVLTMPHLLKGREEIRILRKQMLIKYDQKKKIIIIIM